jgi:hypothetical protein
MIRSDSVDREVAESSGSNCDTADGSTCVIVNCISVRVNVE